MLFLLRLLCVRLLSGGSPDWAWAFEILALRQQLATLKRQIQRAQTRTSDRAFWAILSRLYPDWRRLLHFVQPETVVRWHRLGFRLWWRFRSRSRGRRPINDQLRKLIRQMADAQPTWGAPRIHGELLKLGISVAESTVARYMPRRRRTPSQTWLTFLHNHLACAAGMDFFAIPTATFTVLFGFLVLSHDRRRILHINVTAHPTAEWTRNQIHTALPFDTAPRFLHRDRDSIFNERVRETIRHLGIEDVPSAPKSPWQNPFAERAIGSIRRDLLDHVIVLSEAHARRLLRAYQRYHNETRTHLSLEKDAPERREVHGPERGSRIVALPVLGGLHRRYERRAA